MPKNVTIQNKFTRGLITEAHGLDFPEDACTATENCVFTLIGEVTRRLGIDIELNGHGGIALDAFNSAVSYYRWTNAGGDGETELLVLQVGSKLYFFETSTATVSNPLSQTFSVSNEIDITSFQVLDNTNNAALTECQ